LYVLPSEPLTVTPVAFVAVTVSVDELPDAMDVGFAVTLTVGAAGSVVLTEPPADLAPPHPDRMKRKAGNSTAKGEAIRKADG
jgi:hypothetical protein